MVGPRFEIFGPFLMSIGAAAFILTLVKGAPEAPRFEGRALRFFGHISYSVYLTHLAVLGLNAGSNNESTKEQLNDISSLSSQALAEVREISYNLRPYQLDRLGLTGALQSVVNRIATSSGIPFTVEMDNIDGLLLKQQEINVFRIVQETMTNIVKHSHAAHAAVRIRRTGDTVVLAVSDDGVGFESGKQGFGLTSMAERVRILGGSLDVDSAPKSGTRITARIPLPGRRP